MYESAEVTISTVMFMLFVISTVGNSLVCAVIKRNRDMRYMHEYNH